MHGLNSASSFRARLVVAMCIFCSRSTAASSLIWQRSKIICLLSSLFHNSKWRSSQLSKYRSIWMTDAKIDRRQTSNCVALTVKIQFLYSNDSSIFHEIQRAFRHFNLFFCEVLGLLCLLSALWSRPSIQWMLKTTECDNVALRPISFNKRR